MSCQWISIYLLNHLDFVSWERYIIINMSAWNFPPCWHYGRDYYWSYSISKYSKDNCVSIAVLSWWRRLFFTLYWDNNSWPTLDWYFSLLQTLNLWPVSCGQSFSLQMKYIVYSLFDKILSWRIDSVQFRILRNSCTPWHCKIIRGDCIYSVVAGLSSIHATRLTNICAGFTWNQTINWLEY